jgi:peptide/nickel transport system substrate-binding protein
MFTGPKATQPRKAWDNPEVQAMLEQTMRETDANRRRATFEAMHRRLLEEVPIVALYSSVTHGVTPRHVQGYGAWAVDAPRAWGVQLVR